MRGFKVNFSVKIGLAIAIVIFVLILIVEYVAVNVFVESFSKTSLFSLSRSVRNVFDNAYFNYYLGLFLSQYEDLFNRKDPKEHYKRFVKGIFNSPISELSESYYIKDILVNSSFLYDGKEIITDDPVFNEGKGMKLVKLFYDSGKVEGVMGEVGIGVIYFKRSGDYLFGFRIQPTYFVDAHVYEAFGGEYNLFVVDSVEGIDRVSVVYTNFSYDVGEVKGYYKFFYGRYKEEMKEGKIFVGKSYNFKDIVFFVSMDYGDWYRGYLVTVPVSKVVPMGVLLLVDFVLSGLMFLFMVLLTYRVFRRVDMVKEKIGSFWSEGIDLSYRLELKVGMEEVEGMVEELNKFLDEVEGVVRRSKGTFRVVEANAGILEELGDKVERSKGVLRKQEEVRDMLSEIGGMVNEVSGTVEEMMRSMDVVRGNVEREYGMIEEVSSMVEEVIMTVSNVSKRVSKADGLLKGLSDEAMMGSAEVRKNVEGAREIGMYLGRVLEVVDVIKAISDRIEVLAMNAGIEAAHAGEAGKGFAIVADEMGSLAEDSRKKAEEVEVVVRDVIDRVRSSLELIEGSSEKFMRISEGVKEVSVFVGEINVSMEEINRVNEEIMKKISELVGYSDSVKVAVEENKVGMEEIVKAVYEVNEANSRLSEKFDEMYGVIKEVGEFLVDIGDKVGNMIEGLKELGEMLKKFKVSEVKFSKGITLVE